MRLLHTSDWHLGRSLHSTSLQAAQEQAVGFIIDLAALAGVMMHLARIFKAGADAKGGEVAQLYGALSFYCFRSVWLPVVPTRVIMNLEESKF